jgi:heptosyltransferase-2
VKLVVFCPNWVGDLVMAVPAIRALRRHFAAAELVGLLRPNLSEVLQGTRWFDRYLYHDPRGADRARRGLRFLARLRRERFDLAVLMTNSLRSAALAWLAGAKRRVGYRREGRGLLLSDALAPARRDGRYLPAPVIDYYLALAYHLGCPQESYHLELATTQRDEAAAGRVWQQHGLGETDWVVTLNPGGAFGSAKHWPTEYFAELAARLVRSQPTAVLVLCGPGERETARAIVRQAGHRRVVGLAEHDLGLGLTKACIRRSSLLVTTDSGPRHFAAAFGVPVVTLFGPTHQQWSDTYYAKAVHLQKQVPCGPCQQRVCPLDHRCMRELTPDEVYAKAAELLRRFARSARSLEATAG